MDNCFVNYHFWTKNPDRLTVTPLIVILYSGILNGRR